MKFDVTKPHLWQGKWLSDVELEAAVSELGVALGTTLSKALPTETVLTAFHNMHLFLKNGGKEEFAAYLKKETSLPHGDIHATLCDLEVFFSRRELELKLERELGGKDPFQTRRIDFGVPNYERWASLGCLVHVAPMNAFGVGALSVAEGLLTGNFNILKTGGEDSLFAQLFYQRMFELECGHDLRDFVCVAKISSRKKELLTALLSQADAVAAWGSEEAMNSLRAMCPSHTRFVEWGHKISFVFVAREMTGEPKVYEDIAQEICRIDQQACSSPQCVYVEATNFAELRAFAQKLGSALAKISPTHNALQKSEPEAAEITRVTELCRLEGCVSESDVIVDPNGGWRVLFEMNPGLRASPLFRTIWVKPLALSEVTKMLRPMRSYLQTVGVAAPMERFHEISESFVRAGALRIVTINAMHSGFTGEAHDGVYALTRYLNRVGFQLDSRFDTISDFSEIARWSQKSIPPQKIMSKEDFQNLKPDLENAQLFFKSGGSSGEPKTSVFDVRDYDYQMLHSGFGLLAAGLDPRRDKIMNLFFAGQLYGGFISIFSSLCFVRVPQLPMGACFDFEMVAKTIVREKANALAGTPSYLNQLFSEQGAILEKYRGIEKIFYAGEHFNETTRKHYADKFGVKLIRSAAYGSVDAGPMGYQCLHCEGSVHHLFVNLQDLQILKLHDNALVEGDEVGRLVFSPKARRGQVIEAYEIGDVGRWVRGDCACGRYAPRFEIMGRHGDFFRAAGGFLNFQNFEKTIFKKLGFAGEMQIEILPPSGPNGVEQVVVKLAGPNPLSSENCRHFENECFDGDKDLKEMVQKEKLMQFKVVSVNTSELARNPSSAKLIRIIDRRTT